MATLKWTQPTVDQYGQSGLLDKVIPDFAFSQHPFLLCSEHTDLCPFGSHSLVL